MIFPFYAFASADPILPDGDITLSATSATFTFPETALCIYAGTASGNNTLIVTGATSGDHIMVGWIKQGTDYRVTGVNFGQ